MAQSSKKNIKHKARKVIYISIILITAFLVSSAAYSAYGISTYSSNAYLSNAAAFESPTPSPEPTTAPMPTVRAAFIPDSDELQSMPLLAEIQFDSEKMTSVLEDDILTLSWDIVEGADYYVFYALNENDTLYHKDILWPDISSWLMPDAVNGTVYLFSYKDMGEDSAQDDEIIAAYSLSVVVSAPEPEQTPAPTEKTEADNVKNKYMIIVDKSDFTFGIFTYDESGEYTILVEAFPTAIGASDRMTPNGTFEISSKGAWKSWSTGSYSPYYTRFTSGLYFHGAVYSDKRNDTMYKSYYNDIGTAASSGCLRTTFEGAKWVYYNCPAGTVVKIVTSSDLVDKVIKTPLDPAYPRWDPTDPDKPKLNPPMVITNDILKINESESCEIAGLLKAVDEHVESQNLIYEVVTPPQNGHLNKITFTQEEIDNGAITYTHDGTETETDSFQFTVSNLSSKTGVITFSIKVTLFDDTPPVIIKNDWMYIDPGQSHSLETLLSASDEEAAPDELIYTVTVMPEHGSIPHTFSQSELLSGEVIYIHDGSNSLSDSFTFSLTDGINTLENLMFSISIEAPLPAETTSEP